MSYRPPEINELRTPAELLIPVYSKYNGVQKKTFPESGDLIFVNFKSKGGTESVVNGVYSVINTADIVTWFDPRIKSDCAIKVDSDIYQIKGDPEILTPYIILKTEKVSGGA